jgi:hypothetical protein
MGGFVNVTEQPTFLKHELRHYVDTLFYLVLTTIVTHRGHVQWLIPAIPATPEVKIRRIEV